MELLLSIVFAVIYLLCEAVHNGTSLGKKHMNEIDRINRRN